MSVADTTVVNLTLAIDMTVKHTPVFAVSQAFKGSINKSTDIRVKWKNNVAVRYVILFSVNKPFRMENDKQSLSLLNC